MAAPSPSTIPQRFLANGLQEALASISSMRASVRIACQAINDPNDRGASAPPAMATSSSPRRRRNHASPIATDDDEQAVE